MIFVSMSVLPSCQKNLAGEIGTGPEIVLDLDGSGLDIAVGTKATAITTIPSSLYWCSTTGTSGTSDKQKYAPASGAVSSNKIATGKYQTATATKYNHYVSNVQMAIATTGPTLTIADANTDVLSGVVKASSSTSPAVTLNHIFARTGTLTFNTQSGYTVSNVSWKISKATSGTSGTYNMATDAWTDGTTAMAATAITSSSDMYLTPGTYTFTITYTLTKGDYTNTFTRSGTADLVKGAVNSITATATGGAASQIQISLTLTAWGTNAATVSTLS